MSDRSFIWQGASAIDRARLALERGLLVGMPTETVYGLAADAADPVAIALVYAAKGRPAFNPLIAHVGSIAAAEQEGVFDARARALAEAFWPGALTLVVPVAGSGTVCELARAGLNTIGLRVPNHPLAQALLKAHGRPLAAPSANLSGRLSPTSAEDVAGDFGDDVALVIDGGRCSAGIESTIIAVLPGEPLCLLRPGAISRADIEAVVGPVAALVPGEINAPGQLSSHYAPNAALRLEASSPHDDEVLLGFGPDAPVGVPNLSARGDTVEAAANLYRMLRELDRSSTDTIAVMPIPHTGLGEAINDRLRRAAAPRDAWSRG